MNWIKVALEVNGTTHLTQLNADLEVDVIVKGICDENGVAYESGAYALRAQDFVTDGTQYVTEENKSLLRHGRHLKLSKSPKVRVGELMDQLWKSKDEESSLRNLKSLAVASKDPVLLRELHRQDALQHLKAYASERNFTQEECYRFYKIMGRFLARNYVKQLTETEVKHLVDIITCDRKVTREMLLLSFELLILLRKKGKLYWPIKHLKKLTSYIRLYGEVKLQERTVQFMNYLYLYANDEEERKTVREFMRSSMMITYLNKYIIRENLSHGMKHQLYLYQKIILRKYNNQLGPVELKQEKILENVEYVVSNISLVNQVREVRVSAEESRESLRVARERASSVPGSPMREEAASRDFQRSYDGEGEAEFFQPKIEQEVQLNREVSVESDEVDVDDSGPKDTLDPGDSFSMADDEVTKLARDNLYYFIMNDFKAFENFLFFHKNQMKSVLRIGMGVTNLLCRIFEIHETEPETKMGMFVPLCFLYYDQFIERMFCIAMKLFGRTREEMNVPVDSSEYPVVLRMMEDQLTMALGREPVDFQELEKRLNELTADVVTRKREEMIKAEVERQLAKEPAFVELKDILTPRIISKIQEKRLKFMEAGEHVQQFDYKGQRIVGKRWFVFVSKARDKLHIEECSHNPCQGQHKSLETVLVGDIREIECGSKSNFHKEVYYNLNSERDVFFRPGLRQQEPDLRCPVSVRLHNLNYVDFCAGNEVTMDYWVDGLCHLTGEKMKSDTMTEEFNYLMDIELMSHIAELEGIAFPDKAPEVPPLPPDFEFSLP